MTTPRELEELAILTPEQLQILRTLDIAAFRQMVLPDVGERAVIASDETILAALHKSRYKCSQLDASERTASGVWLREHGMGRMLAGEVLEGN